MNKGVCNMELKIPRFIKEFANYQKESIKDNLLMSEDQKQESISRVDDAVLGCKYGYISIDEAVKILSKLSFIER